MKDRLKEYIEWELENALDEIENILNACGEMACYTKSRCLSGEDIDDIEEIIKKVKGEQIMNKSAKEMFEELGYTKLQKHDDVGDYIEYISNDEDCDCITFYCDSKTFCIGEYVLCNVKILQAINKQVEELGWNK